MKTGELWDQTNNVDLGKVKTIWNGMNDNTIEMLIGTRALNIKEAQKILLSWTKSMFDIKNEKEKAQ